MITALIVSALVGATVMRLHARLFAVAPSPAELNPVAFDRLSYIVTRYTTHQRNIGEPAHYVEAVNGKEIKIKGTTFTRGS